MGEKIFRILHWLRTPYFFLGQYAALESLEMSVIQEESYC